MSAMIHFPLPLRPEEFKTLDFEDLMLIETLRQEKIRMVSSLFDELNIEYSILITGDKYESPSSIFVIGHIDDRDLVEQLSQQLEVLQY